MTLGFDRHCAEIVRQTSLLIGHLDGADVTVPVPTCPGWNVSQPPSDVAMRRSSTSGWSESLSAEP
jgi:hypothetical protein